jgi:parallel beta-helix repeat protein
MLLKIRKRMLILIFILLSALICQYNFRNFPQITSKEQKIFSYSDRTDPSNRLGKSQYTKHDPISIWGNDDFRAVVLSEGWAGNGTATNPFIIEALYFNESNVVDSYLSPAIEIHETDLFFHIRNCRFESNGIDRLDGIWLDHVSNVKIYNNDIISCFNSIEVSYCFNISITSNWLYSGKGFGIWSGYSENITVNNNTISKNQDFDIFLDYSHFITVNNNLILGNQGSRHTSIFLADSHSNTVINNYISNVGGGIMLIASTNNLLRNNSINYSNYDAIFLEISSDNFIINNRIFNSLQNGISFELSDYNDFNNNKINFTLSYGFYCEGSDGCTIKFNQITRGGSYNFQSADNSYIVDSENASGIHIVDSSYAEIMFNEITSTQGNGIHLMSSIYCSIYNNSVSTSYNDGINVMESHSNDFMNNTIDYSKENGISLIGSNKNLMLKNTLSNNIGFGIIVDENSYFSNLSQNIYSNNTSGSISYRGTIYNSKKSAVENLLSTAFRIILFVIIISMVSVSLSRYKKT